MARTVSWGNRIVEITEAVQNSVIETYTRKDIERIFDIKRASAQLLMKAIGEIDSVGGKHLTARAAVLDFLKSMNSADNLATARMERIITADPAPRPQRLKGTVPEDLKSVMFRSLPPEITVEQGRIEIVGRDAAAVLASLFVLAKALENDLGTIQQILDPVLAPPAVQDDELSRMFADLRALETARGIQKAS